MPRIEKPYTKEQENREVQALMEGIQKRLARIEAEHIAAAHRYTVIFEKRENSWGARIIGLPGYVAAGATLEETCGLIAHKIAEHEGVL